MQNLHTLQYDALVDLLSSYTVKYTQMIANHQMNTEEFYNCKIMVKYLQEEIEARDRSNRQQASKNETGINGNSS